MELLLAKRNKSNGDESYNSMIQKQNKKKKNVIDVDYERVVPPPVSPTPAESNTEKSTSSSSSSSKASKFQIRKGPNLLDLALDTNQHLTHNNKNENNNENGDSATELDLNSLPIPFVDQDQNYIPVKVAFMVTLDGTNHYGIGIPYDHAVAIVEETDRDKATTTDKDDDGTLSSDIRYIMPMPGQNSNTISSTSAANDKNSKNTNTNNNNNSQEDDWELIQLMAKHAKEELGVTMQTTPKIFTISSDDGLLDEYTNRWETELLPSTRQEHEQASPPQQASINELLVDPSLSLKRQEEEFLEFMRQELGEEEVDKIMNEEDEEEEEFLDPEIMKDLFDIPGMEYLWNNNNNNEESIPQEILSSIQQDAEKTFGNTKTTTATTSTTNSSTTTTWTTNSDPNETNDIDANLASTMLLPDFFTFQKASALRLIGFHMPGRKKSYSLVKLLQPYTIVGRYAPRSMEEESNHNSSDEDDQNENTRNKRADDDLMFELLTPEEEELVIPRLEALCRDDLRKAGLSL